jgi:hypothetical protein
VACRTLSVSARMTRAKIAISATPAAIAALTVRNPSETTITTASKNGGMASIVSTKRPNTVSTKPPMNPAMSPMDPPMTSAIPTATNASRNEERVP